MIRPNCNGRISFSFNAVFNIFGFCLEIKWTCDIFIVFLSTGPTNDPHLLASPPWSHKRCVSIGHFTVPCHSYIPCALSQQEGVRAHQESGQFNSTHLMDHVGVAQWARNAGMGGFHRGWTTISLSRFQCLNDREGYQGSFLNLQSQCKRRTQ